MPSKKVTMRASMSNQISHFGIMGGLYNRKISGRSMNRVTSRLEIPAGAASGLRYMKMHNLLSRNPLGSGGVGRMFNNRPRGSGLGSRSTTSDKSVSNLGSELGKHEEKVKGEDIYDTTNPAIPNVDCGTASAPSCFCTDSITNIVNCNAPCKGTDADCKTGDRCNYQYITATCCSGAVPSFDCDNNCVGVSGDSGIMMGLSGGVLVASNIAGGQFCCTSVTTVNKKYECNDSTKFCRLKDIEVSLCGKSDFLTCPLQPWQRYSCSGGSCIKDSVGELPSGCNGSCEAGSKYKCDPDLGTCSTDPTGTQQTKAACDGACVQNKYKCDPDKGTCSTDPTGTQQTKAACDGACNKPQKKVYFNFKTRTCEDNSTNSTENKFSTETECTDYADQQKPTCCVPIMSNPDPRAVENPDTQGLNVCSWKMGNADVESYINTYNVRPSGTCLTEELDEYKKNITCSSTTDCKGNNSVCTVISDNNTQTYCVTDNQCCAGNAGWIWADISATATKNGGYVCDASVLHSKMPLIGNDIPFGFGPNGTLFPAYNSSPWDSSTNEPMCVPGTYITDASSNVNGYRKIGNAGQQVPWVRVTGQDKNDNICSDNKGVTSMSGNSWKVNGEGGCRYASYSPLKNSSFPTKQGRGIWPIGSLGVGVVTNNLYNNMTGIGVNDYGNAQQHYRPAPDHTPSQIQNMESILCNGFQTGVMPAPYVGKGADVQWGRAVDSNNRKADPVLDPVPYFPSGTVGGVKGDGPQTCTRCGAGSSGCNNGCICTGCDAPPPEIYTCSKAVVCDSGDGAMLGKACPGTPTETGTLNYNCFGCNNIPPS